MGKHVAQPYVAGKPETEVIGQTVLAFSENLQSELIRPLLPQHGLGNIDPEAWYPHQAWLDVLKAISENAGGNAMNTFVAFGQKVVETAVMPPELKTIPDVLNALHSIHHMNLRNAVEEEGYVIEAIDDNHYLVYENTPNPSYAIYGFLWGICKRFKQPNEKFTVKEVENPKPDEIPGTCFDIKWG